MLESQDKRDLLPLMLRNDFIGASVTMPHKVALLKDVDVLTDEALAIGAINTIYVRVDEYGNRRCIGTNTDCIGVRDAFLRNYPRLAEDAHQKPAMVIGGGGACRAVVYALSRWLECSVIYLVNRDKNEADEVITGARNAGFEGEIVYVTSVEQANDLPAPFLAVGAVPDISPKTPGEILTRSIVMAFLEKPHKGVVLEMCYHPNPWTEFAAIADRVGWEAVLGTEVMIYQGIAQDALWTERSIEELPLDDVRKVISDAIKSHRVPTS